MKNKLGYFIIGSALIWGAVVIGCASVLKGIPEKDSVIQILSAATFFHLLVIWIPMARILKKNKK